MGQAKTAGVKRLARQNKNDAGERSKRLADPKSVRALINGFFNLANAKGDPPA